MATFYRYGMKLRGFAPRAQPIENLVTASEDPARKYWAILEYSSPLSAEQIRTYDLDPIDSREIWSTKIYSKSI